MNVSSLSGRYLLAALVASGLLIGCQREPESDVPDLVVEERRPRARDDSGAADAQAVAVLLTDSGIEIPGALPPGRKAFHIRNRGTEHHGFVLDGTAGVIRLEGALPPGEETVLVADLPEGIYALFCPIPGHRRGMARQIAVSERAARP